MENKMEFWLSFDNQAERFMLPVNPSALEIVSTHGYEDVEVNKLGEYSIIRGKKLKDISFASFFPRDYNPIYCNYASIMNPWDSVALIEKWKESGKPMRLIVTGTPVNFACTIRDFTYREEGGSVGDISFSISFKEFIFIKFRTMTSSDIEAKVSATSDRPDTREKKKSYTVKSGDSLWKIAQANLGSGSRYPEIAKLNGIKPPYIIHPGKVLKLP